MSKEASVSDAVAPSAGLNSLLQDGRGLEPLDYSGNRPVQPFPRSPKLQRKTGAAAPTQDQLTRRVEELQDQSIRTQAHIQSLKKRRADLTETTKTMKQQVRDRFQNLHAVLDRDQQAVLDSLDLDLRETRARLDQVLKEWEQHQDQVNQHLNRTRGVLNQSPEAREDARVPVDEDCPSPKRPDASKEQIRLKEESFQKLLKSLSSVCRTLSAELQRKTLLLDWFRVELDHQTSHSQLSMSADGRSVSFCDASSSQSSPSSSSAEHPLQFDKVCCVLGSAPLPAGRSYWEVDVRCSAAWAVGVAYGRLQRRGGDKASRLGRNRDSWSLELRGGVLSAWHNNRSVACRAAPPGRVGVWVDYQGGRLAFYDADTMAVLQSFSAAVTPVFDRVHHRFTEPLYPAVRFLRPPHDQAWTNHLRLCNDGLN